MDKTYGAISMSPTWSFLPASPLLLSTTGFQAGTVNCQWKDLKKVRSMCMWFNESIQKGEVTYLQTLRNHVQKDCVCGISRLLYDVIMLVVLDCGFAQNHTLSLWRICLHTGASSFMTSAELDPNEVAQQLWRSNRTWWARFALVLSCTFMYFPPYVQKSHPPKKLQCVCTELMTMHFEVVKKNTLK